MLMFGNHWPVQRPQGGQEQARWSNWREACRWGGEGGNRVASMSWTGVGLPWPWRRPKHFSPASLPITREPSRRAPLPWGPWRSSRSPECPGWPKREDGSGHTDGFQRPLVTRSCQCVSCRKHRSGSESCCWGSALVLNVGKNLGGKPLLMVLRRHWGPCEQRRLHGYPPQETALHTLIPGGPRAAEPG